MFKNPETRPVSASEAEAKKSDKHIVDRADKCVHIRSSSESKDSYVCLNLRTRKIVDSPHVRFNEQEFPLRDPRVFRLLGMDFENEPMDVLYDVDTDEVEESAVELVVRSQARHNTRPVLSEAQAISNTTKTGKRLISRLMENIKST